MKNTHQELIDALQSEFDVLEEELAGCLLERDYKSADKLDKALSYTHSILSILKNLEHPEHAKIQALKIKFRCSTQSKLWLFILKNLKTSFKIRLLHSKMNWQN